MALEALRDRGYRPDEDEVGALWELAPEQTLTDAACDLLENWRGSWPESWLESILDEYRHAHGQLPDPNAVTHSEWHMHIDDLEGLHIVLVRLQHRLTADQRQRFHDICRWEEGPPDCVPMPDIDSNGALPDTDTTEAREADAHSADTKNAIVDPFPVDSDEGAWESESEYERNLGCSAPLAVRAFQSINSLSDSLKARMRKIVSEVDPAPEPAGQDHMSRLMRIFFAPGTSTTVRLLRARCADVVLDALQSKRDSDRIAGLELVSCFFSDSAPAEILKEVMRTPELTAKLVLDCGLDAAPDEHRIGIARLASGILKQHYQAGNLSDEPHHG